MQIKILLLILCLLVLPVNSSTTYLDFIRKTISLLSAVGVVYEFKQNKAEEVVKVLHEEFNTKMNLTFHTKLTNLKKFKKNIKYPAYVLRGLTGVFTFVVLDHLLNNEND